METASASLHEELLEIAGRSAFLNVFKCMA